MLEIQQTDLGRKDRFIEVNNLYFYSLKQMIGNTGGQTRYKKENLVVDVTKSIVETAINETGINKDRVFYRECDKIEVPPDDSDYLSRSNYLSMIDEKVANLIADDLHAYRKDTEVDFTIFVDNKPVIITELKAYAETAMLRRFIHDASGIKKVISPEPSFVLFQLENALGGDYDRDVPVCTGSMKVHELLSRVPINIDILTLLDGKRTSTRPIHDKMFSKGLSWYKFNKAVDYFRDKIRAHAE